MKSICKSSKRHCFSRGLEVFKECVADAVMGGSLKWQGVAYDAMVSEWKEGQAQTENEICNKSAGIHKSAHLFLLDIQK